MKSGDINFDGQFLRKSLKDPEPEIRAIALSLLSMQSRAFIEKALKENKNTGMLKGGRVAVSILLPGSRTYDDKEDAVISQLMEIKNLVLKAKLSPVEFVMIVYVLHSGYFLDHLYELAYAKKEKILLKSMIPVADLLSRRQAVK